MELWNNVNGIMDIVYGIWNITDAYGIRTDFLHKAR